MKKTCALILSGFLRDEANLDNLRIFLENNPKYIIDLYIYTYSSRGTKSKITEHNKERPTSRSVWHDTPVTLETFSSLNSYIKSIHIKSYDETQKYINNFIEEKDLVRIAENEASIRWVKKYKVETSLKWQMNTLLSQFYMNWQNIQEIKKIDEKYDIVIKSRFDMNHHLLKKIPLNVQEKSFLGHAHRWFSRVHRAVTKSVNRKQVFDTKGNKNRNSFPNIADLYFILHFDSLSCLENAYDINSVLNRYEKDNYWVKDFRICAELNLSIGLFIECNLDKIQVKHIARCVGLNRKNKY